jgi:hypothetical protein
MRRATHLCNEQEYGELMSVRYQEPSDVVKHGVLMAVVYGILICLLPANETHVDRAPVDRWRTQDSIVPLRAVFTPVVYRYTNAEKAMLGTCSWARKEESRDWL